MNLIRKHKPVTNPTSPTSAAPTVAVINESTVLSDSDLTPIIAALQVQCDRDFGPIWNITCKLVQIPKSHAAPSNAWQLVVLDNADQAGALGYHDFTAQGMPIAKIFAATDQQYGAKVSVTMSHELLEMLADSGCDLSAQSDNTTFVAYETCDPCEADALGYDINGVTMSDFCTPEYFMPQPPPNIALDFMKHIDTPFGIAPGGYLNIWTPDTGWGQAFNGEVVPSRLHPRTLERGAFYNAPPVE